MASIEPDCLRHPLKSRSISFHVDFDALDDLAQVDAGLKRLGCRTESAGFRLLVWLPDHPAGEVLSSRERQLVCLASKGHTDKEIAGLVGLSIYTVRSYWVRICNKLEANNRTHAVSIVFANERETSEAD